MKSICVLFLLLMIHSLCLAETIVLKSGETIEGKLLEKTDKYVKIDFYGVALTYYLTEIESLGSQSVTSDTKNFSGSIEAKPQKLLLSISEEYSSSVVTIAPDDMPINEAPGIGFIVREDGLIMTNIHVLVSFGFGEVKIRLKDGRVFPVESVVGYDFVQDICVLKIDAHNLRSITIGNSANLKKGDDLIAISINQDKIYVSYGGKFLERKKWFESDYLRTSVNGHKGVSGSPVINSEGLLVGIYSAGHDNMKNWRFIVPIDSVRKIINNDNPVSFADFVKISRNSYVYDLIGSNFSLLGDLDSAIKWYKTAIDRKPDFAQAYISLVLAYMHKHNFVDALAVAREAEKLENNSEVYHNLATAYLGNDRFSEALANIEKAIELGPDYSEAYKVKGLILLNLGRFEEARDVFRQGLAIDDNNCLSNLCLTGIYNKEGKRESARKVYDKYIQDKCSFPLDLIQELKQLGLLFAEGEK